MKYVYGPVPSRRLGQSLGIDPVPLKTCNWNCVYCQLGRSRPVVNERKDYFPPDEILAEVDRTLGAHRPGEIDWVTFVGSGEPLLHARLGWMIRQVKARTEIPVAVITNGSLLHRPDVREELATADAVLPSLDAGNADLYRCINRPHPQITFERLVEGIQDAEKIRILREEFVLAGTSEAMRKLERLNRTVALFNIHQPPEAPDNIDALVGRGKKVLEDLSR